MAVTRSTLFPNLACSFRPNKPHPSAVDRRIIAIPARDRVINFGKYKGKMLGALPSAYLKWVSKNLRAGDSIHWATLADQVLEDPVYKDRLEWEFADVLLNGNRNLTSSSRNESAVSQLVEVSERFGWDNEDKIGWSRVNFELLGTSKGGRIPRLGSDSHKNGVEEVRSERSEDERVFSETETRRKQRRERTKMKKGEDKKDQLEILIKNEDSVVNKKNQERLAPDPDLDNNTFPGRQTLLKKVLNSSNKNKLFL